MSDYSNKWNTNVTAFVSAPSRKTRLFFPSQGYGTGRRGRGLRMRAKLRLSGSIPRYHSSPTVCDTTYSYGGRYVRRRAVLLVTTSCDPTAALIFPIFLFFRMVSFSQSWEEGRP